MLDHRQAAARGCNALDSCGELELAEQLMDKPVPRPTRIRGDELGRRARPELDLDMIDAVVGDDVNARREPRARAIRVQSRQSAGDPAEGNVEYPVPLVGDCPA